VRFRKGGEHIDFNGHRRELKTLLHEAGIPPWVRDGLPLLHDAAGLFCVPGIVVRDAATGVQAGDRVAVRWYPREPAPHIR
jgi:tRNA(Ile)-lysidine synthase